MLSKSNVKLRRETYNLPGTIDEICGLVKDVLSGGAVQRIILETDRPVVVYRAAVGDSELDEVFVDLEAALRHTQMFEYNDGPSSFLALFEACQMIRAEKLHPTHIVVGPSSKTLRNWLGVRFPPMLLQGESILGIPVHHVKSLPDETLVICGSPYHDGEPADITVTIKITMEVRNEASKQDACGCGSDPEGDTGANGILGDPPSGGDKPSWQNYSDT